MDIKYYREQQHNYMVMPGMRDQFGVAYQKKMLTANRLMHILEISERIIDGDIYDYYDITSKISLRQLYGSRQLDMDDIISVMNDIYGAFDEIDRYLLDTGRIIISPDHIYYSYISNRFLLLYNVSSEEYDIETGYPELMDFFLEHVTSGDRQATDYVYQIYDYYEKGNFNIWDAIRMLPEDTDTFTEEIQIPSSSINTNEIVTVVEQGTGDRMGDIRMEPPENESGYEAYSIDDSKEKCRGFGLLSGVLIVFAVLIASACLVIRLLFNLNEEENLLLLAGICSAAAVLISGIVIGIKNMSGNKETDRTGEIKAYMESEWETRQLDLCRKIDMEELRAPSIREERRNDRLISAQETVDAEDGCTVFFEPNPEDTSYKLYALDRKNKQHISVDKFPFVIGKMSEYVDFCIEHPTISRIHARLDCKDGNLYIQDMNSTNGIYLNGIRMTPNETRDLDVGDEIRLGSLSYCLRYS